MTKHLFFIYIFILIINPAHAQQPEVISQINRAHELLDDSLTLQDQLGTARTVFIERVEFPEEWEDENFVEEINRYYSGRNLDQASLETLLFEVSQWCAQLENSCPLGAISTHIESNVCRILIQP